MIYFKRARFLSHTLEKYNKLSTCRISSLSLLILEKKTHRCKYPLFGSNYFYNDSNVRILTFTLRFCSPNYIPRKFISSTSCSSNANEKFIGDNSTTFTTDVTITPSTNSNIDSSTTFLETFSPSTEKIINKSINSSKIWESSFWPQDVIIDLLNTLQSLSGQPYALTIAATTILIRLLALPLFITAQKNSSRMAHMRPEMEILKQKIDAAMNKNKVNQVQHTNQMRELFIKYDCNPLKSIVVPFVQIPVFMSMFFALRKMPDYFPIELSKGGMLWFPDLTIPDSTLVLPLLSASSFLVMIELGKEQMMATNVQQGRMFINIFRGLGILIVPVTMNFSSAMFCYWITNNLCSIGQSIFFKSSIVRKYLDIWDLPKPIHVMEPQIDNQLDFIQRIIQKVKGKGVEKTQIEMMKEHNERVETRRLMKKVQEQMADSDGNRGDYNRHMNAKKKIQKKKRRKNDRKATR